MSAMYSRYRYYRYRIGIGCYIVRSVKRTELFFAQKRGFRIAEFSYSLYSVVGDIDTNPTGFNCQSQSILGLTRGQRHLAKAAQNGPAHTVRGVNCTHRRVTDRQTDRDCEHRHLFVSCLDLLRLLLLLLLLFYYLCCG